MLIITRRPGEKIMLGDDIVVHIMEIVGNTARIGIEAPRSIPVFRKEVYVDIHQGRGDDDDAEQVDRALQGLKARPGD